MRKSNDFVFSVIFLNSLTSISPLSFTEANLITAPFFFLNSAKVHNLNDAQAQ